MLADSMKRRLIFRCSRSQLSRQFSPEFLLESGPPGEFHTPLHFRSLFMKLGAAVEVTAQQDNECDPGSSSPKWRWQLSCWPAQDSLCKVFGTPKTPRSVLIRTESSLSRFRFPMRNTKRTSKKTHFGRNYLSG